jgi:HSP20 family protein
VKAIAAALPKLKFLCDKLTGGIMFTNNDDALDNDEKNAFLKKENEQESWFKEEYEGQLSIDVYQNDKEIVIKSTIAGIRPEDIDIAINNDMVTIRGSRQKSSEAQEEDYLFQECYWGGFSRSIILPQAVKADKVKATLENGILTIRLPKAPPVEKVKVRVKSTKKIKKEKVNNITKIKSKKNNA